MNDTINCNKNDFLLVIEDVYSSKNVGTVVTGIIQNGAISTGDELFIMGGDNALKTVCRGVEMNGKIIDHAQQGNEVGLLLPYNTSILIGQIAMHLSILLTIDDVYSSIETGTVITGMIENGDISTGDEVVIMASDGSFKTFCRSIEKEGEIIEIAKKGDIVWLQLPYSTSIQKGQVVVRYSHI